jgi:hypothetical protein
MRLLDSLHLFLAKQLGDAAPNNFASRKVATIHLKNWLTSSFNAEAEATQLQINRLIEIQTSSWKVNDRELAIYSSLLLGLIYAFNHAHKQAKESIQFAIKCKDDYQTTSGHDLSVPIALSQVLIDGITFPATKLQKELRGIIESAGKDDQNRPYLLESLLDFSRIHLYIIEQLGTESFWLPSVQTVITKADEIARMQELSDPILPARMLQLHAQWQYVNQDYKQSEELIVKALTMADSKLGAYHPYRTELLIDQTLALEKLNDYPNASEAARNAEFCESGGSVNKLRLSIVSYHIGRLMQHRKEDPYASLQILKKALCLMEECPDSSIYDRLWILEAMRNSAEAGFMNAEILETSAQIASLHRLIGENSA